MILHSSWNFQKWIIEAYLEEYEELQKLFPNDKDNRTFDTATNNGYQYYFKKGEIAEAEDIVRKKINNMLQEMQAPIRAGEIDKSWSVRYKKHGWQALHNHAEQYKVISAVLNFSDRVEDETDTSSGAFYSVLPDVDGNSTLKIFPHYPGLLIVSEGNIFHGSYPTKHIKDVMVFDFLQEIVDDTDD